jgi:hypothetical protein
MAFEKRDRTNQLLRPGDICIYKGMLAVYLKPSWGGENSKGEYGQFITSLGKHSVRYSNVTFAFDPMGKRRNNSEEVKELCRKFYEG